MTLMLRFQLLELGFLFGSQHLVDFLATFRFRAFHDLLDGRFLRIGQVELIESRRQMRTVHSSRRASWRRGLVVGLRRLQA